MYQNTMKAIKNISVHLNNAFKIMLKLTDDKEENKIELKNNKVKRKKVSKLARFDQSS